MPILATFALCIALQAPAQTTPSSPPKLQMTDVTVGTGPAVVRGDQIWVEYKGELSDGKVFDDTKGRPFIIIIGLGNVIPGWEKGLIGMKVGGERKLIIPPELAYGPRGHDPIPPNSTLNFTVKLTKLAHPIQRVKVTIDKAGKGVGAKWDEDLGIDYVGKLTNGTEFDNSIKRGAPLRIQLGKTRLIAGFSLGLLGIKKGETRTITIPPDLAYGPRAVATIPANSTLIFKLTRVK